MTSVVLKERNSLDSVRSELSTTSCEDGLVELIFPEQCFIETDAIAYLTSWLLFQKSVGHKITINEDSSVVGYLARMNFHRVLELPEPDHGRRPDAGRFIPIMLVRDSDDVFETVNAISDIVLQQFDNARDFLPAFEWAINEIVDNIFIHSQSKSPGVVCAQLFPQLNRLNIAICDSGIGLRGSLGSSLDIISDVQAIEKALERGVTRDSNIGQGNGMAGSLEIISQNKGSICVSSGSAQYGMTDGRDNGYSEADRLDGTCVSLSFNLDNPVALDSIWIASAGWSYIDAEAERVAEYGISIKESCNHTGSRPPATRLRRKIISLLPDVEGAIKLDFKGVASVSSSFLDELLGRLNAELGNETFNQRIVVSGLSMLHTNMANNVIAQRLASETRNGESAMSWIATDSNTGNYQFRFPECALELNGDPALYSAIRENDWFLIASPQGVITRIGKALRVRSTETLTTVYFEELLKSDEGVTVDEIGFSLPTKGQIARLQWSDFVNVTPSLVGRSIESFPRLAQQPYIRELLQLAVSDDLLGPANGPYETIVDMGVRDRYLVGKFAPTVVEQGGIEGLSGPLAEDASNIEEEPTDLDIHSGRHEPGAEFDSTSGRVTPDDSAGDEIEAASNQSLVPSSFGMTFCVAGDVKAVELEARWGRYERDYDTEIYKIRRNRETGEQEDGPRARVWQRIPCGGKLTLPLQEGVIANVGLDPENPEVRLQGTIRPLNKGGDRLITVFLVNAQEDPPQNRDTAWIFQPTIMARSSIADGGKAIFRRKAPIASGAVDPERDSLEMIYRHHVEFAVGHGVAIHATISTDNTERATEVQTVIIPEFEVPVTETPGLKPEDRPAMRKLVSGGYLDMKSLAKMERPELVDALSILVNDYDLWITNQATRMATDAAGHEVSSDAAIKACQEIHVRLLEGIAVLADKSQDKALEAFRFANLAMANQRIHSIYSLSQRRGEKLTLTDIDVAKNRSWRPFQLAFLLLSLPSLANPLHRDRTVPVEAFADLLWFPTGGGKTEAYLGVAAFAMAIRRFQGDLGGYDGTRGLTVIMRYTLRLLTLQQFQRGTALLCAMESLRKDALKTGDASLGYSPFTIGLWVGNKVTPGNTADSDRAIQDVRDTSKFDAGKASPAQLTSCPWCGSEIQAGRDIEVDKSAKRTTIYCGDKRGNCEFSRGQSAKNEHPGLPVLVVDEEIYHRPPSMLIATVDKFAMMAWRGEVRTLFGNVDTECDRHGLIWPDADCNGNHPSGKGQPKASANKIVRIRPPDLIIQDEFHLISGPLGTMVGLYESAIDELASWQHGSTTIKPKIIASTATVRKAKEQVASVFMRNVCVFPPSGLDIDDNFFSVQRSIETNPGRRYLGICSPGSSRPAMLIRVYTAFLTGAQFLFERFGQAADPYLTTVGYFNSLRELGGMKRLSEDDVQTRSYRVQMSLVDRPGLAQRSVNTITELTSRVSSSEIPKNLDRLEVKFKSKFDQTNKRYSADWSEGELRSVDIVLATNMLSVGVDINRLGLMVVNGQPKGTAEYIQATSRVGRSFPGLVCTVLTWARPRDLSHYETFEHYHATFYKHVEAQSVTPFSPRALDRGLTGTAISLLRLRETEFNPNSGAGSLHDSNQKNVTDVTKALQARALTVTELASSGQLTQDMMKERIDRWASEAAKGGRHLAYEKKGKNKDKTVGLLARPSAQSWTEFTVPMSMREVEPGVRLMMNSAKNLTLPPAWAPPPISVDDEGGEE